MTWLLVLGAAGVAVFALGAVAGAPYLPTRRAQRQAALKLLDLKSGQTLLDLGCGDGNLLMDAAKQGIRGIGYEINPLLWLIAKLRALRYRSLIKIYLTNYWQIKLPPADGIYVFLIKRYMPKLAKKLSEEIKHPAKVVSFAFKIPDHDISKTHSGLFLYHF